MRNASCAACKFWLLLFVLASTGFAQNSSAFANLKIDFGRVTTHAWGRYVVSGDTVVQSGWVRTTGNVRDYVITRLPAGNDSRVKGVLYLPGCAVRTFDISIPEARDYQYLFSCEPIPQIQLRGSIPPLGKLYDDDVVIEAKCVIAWAGFFGYDDGTTTEIPLGSAVTLDDETHFHLTIPDLSRDPLVNSANHEGQVRIFIRSQKTGQIIDQWRFVPKDSTVRVNRFGGIPVALIKPDSGVLSFCPIRSVLPHDGYGFAARPPANGDCQP